MDTLKELIEEVAEAICDKYCRYTAESYIEDMDQDQLDRICKSCPMNKLTD